MGGEEVTSLFRIAHQVDADDVSNAQLPVLICVFGGTPDPTLTGDS